MTRWTQAAPQFIFAALATLQAGLPQALAKGSVEATQLEIVAMDASIPCDRTFFRSSSHFQGTIFAMPRVTQGAAPDGKRSIEIIPTTKGQYILYVRLFFPVNDSYIKGTGASSVAVDRDACNFDIVKDALNRNINNDAQKITTVSRMPLTSLELSLSGVHEIARIGRSVEDNQEADILDYVGKSLTFSFNITEKEKTFIEAQVVKIDGLAAQVKFRFQARSNDGSVRADIDAEALQANFQAQAKGQAYMVDADVTAALRASMDSNVIRISVDAGSSDSSGKIAEMLIDKILKESSLAALPTKEADKVQAEAAPGKIAVKAVLEVIATKMSRSIEMKMSAVPESATAQSELRLKANRVEDGNLLEVAVLANYQDPTSGVYLNAGQSVAISASYSYLEKIDYNPRKTFVTTGMIAELNLAAEFPEITSPSMTIQDKNINGSLMAIGTWSALGVVAEPGSYRWVQVERMATRTRESSKVYAPTLAELKNIPVSLTFSEVGEQYRIQLAKMVGNNDWWSSYFDSVSGRLIITAKRDLGKVTFREDMHGPDNIESAPVVMNEVIMESYSMFGSVTPYKSLVIAEDKAAITKQRTIMLYMTRPSDEKNFSLPSLDIQNDVIKPTVTFEMRDIKKGSRLPLK